MINLTEALADDSQQLLRYTFDGPCRYSRYDSVLAAHHGTFDNQSILSIWKIHLRRISCFFPPEKRQQWNRQHQPARDILARHSNSSAAHRTVARSESGRLASADDLWKSVFLDRKSDEIRPRIFNYAIDGTTWQFSETGHQFFGDSGKHILLANCSEFVCYAGEFHVRPKFGWTRLDGEWELVVDNASGTYSPDANLLANLKELLVFNFPGLNVITYDYKDPMLKDSVGQLEIAMQSYKRKQKPSIGHSTVSHIQYR